MTTIPVLLVPSEVRRAIEATPDHSGAFTLRWSEPERCGVVIAVGVGSAALNPFPVRDHFLEFADVGPVGTWHAGDEQHSTIWREYAGRGGAVTLDVLRERLPGLWRVGSGVGYFVLVVSTTEGDSPIWTAWAVNGDAALPIKVDVERDDEGLSTLGEHWPTELMGAKHVAVIGVGSIGSVTADVLAGFGVGRMTLIDPDRLEFHNLVRHTLPRSEVGRNKAIAVAEALQRSHAGLEAVGLPKDVLWDTDAIRASIADADVIVGATDGILPRRTIVHIARRLSKPSLLGCVLLNGAIGEVLRFRPAAQHGCLECRRRTRQDLFTLDSSAEAPYGSGSSHLPMTAIGTDLALVGHVLAKASVCTILESTGMADQRLPGETAIIGLRPTGAAPTPYDISRAGEIRWLPADPPIDGCPTCSVAT
ncbi:ThiF family adenylyltransferase [Microbacterium sp. KSW4-4]|uniref:HesA/MoeB/ThiF family protein n=1 Tax=Microbacterium sp. KSW4-4 TaxID=2851651 RepID=UPI001FFCE981|nr:ThiF family adenylyltransferase [Microbacterium sp. KSW4-4]MCK2032203.1 ThiF family adenylyltransferase [Microbacterium sp. KSW4-4]